MRILPGMSMEQSRQWEMTFSFEGCFFSAAPKTPLTLALHGNRPFTAVPSRPQCRIGFLNINEISASYSHLIHAVSPPALPFWSL